MNSTARGNVTVLRDPGGPDMEAYPAIASLVNIDAEQALLGALLINNRAYDRVVELVRAVDFSSAVNARVYEAIGKLIDHGSVANPVTLKTLFDQDGALTEIGGAQYLARLAGAAVTIINAEDYATVIADLARRRAIIVACQDAWIDAGKPILERSAADILSDFDRTLIEISGHGIQQTVPFNRAVDDAITAAEAVYKANGNITGLPTGLTDLDRRLGGLKTGLYIIAGRPSMGKSALATTVAESVAGTVSPVTGRSRVVAIFSLEMTAEQIATRLIAKASRVSSDLQNSGPISKEQIEQIVDARDDIAGLAIEIDDGMSTTVSQIRARCRRMKRRGGLDLIIVDYIGLLASDRARSENRVQEMSEITRSLKRLAIELDVPVIAVSQLNRALESREDKRPTLADLRESGSIEQDADVVIFVYREEYYLERQAPQQSASDYDSKFEAWQAKIERVRGVADLIIAKHRRGKTGSVKARWDGARTCFENLAWQQ